MEWLCLPGMANTSIRFEGSSLLTWRSGKSRLADIEPMLHVVSTMVDAVPGFVWQNLGVRPPRA